MKRVIMLVAGVAVAALVASPAFAQRQGIGENAPQVNTRVHPEGVRQRGQVVRGTRHAPSAYRARAQAQPYAPSAYRARAQAQPSGESARDAAMRECTESSRKYGESTWGALQVQTQRSCMAGHGQLE